MFVVFITKKVDILPFICGFWGDLAKNFTESLFRHFPTPLPSFAQFPRRYIRKCLPDSLQYRREACRLLAANNETQTIRPDLGVKCYEFRQRTVSVYTTESSGRFGTFLSEKPMGSYRYCNDAERHFSPISSETGSIWPKLGRWMPGKSELQWSP